MIVPDWQVTATTIYCDAVDDDVTVIVYKDWSMRCTGYQKYLESPTREALQELGAKSKNSGRKLKCEGPEDYRVTDYRDKLRAEEEAKVKD